MAANDQSFTITPISTFNKTNFLHHMYAFAKYYFVILLVCSSILFIPKSEGISNTRILQKRWMPQIQYPLVVSISITPSLYFLNSSNASRIWLPIVFHSLIVDLPEQEHALWNRNLQGSFGFRTPTSDQLILTVNLSELSWQNRFWKITWFKSGFYLQKVMNSIDPSKQKFILRGFSSPIKWASNSQKLLPSLRPNKSDTGDDLVRLTQTLLRSNDLPSSKPTDRELQQNPNL